jgi:hypothetical protein
MKVQTGGRCIRPNTSQSVKSGKKPKTKKPQNKKPPNKKTQNKKKPKVQSRTGHEGTDGW